MANDAMHWSDFIAQDIISKKGDKETYTVAAGITPSGTIHIGKFREIITQEMVARALKRLGKKVRFIYSWDDYDTFRKVPTDMPDQEYLKSVLYQPICDIKDVYGVTDSYARYNEITLENDAPRVGLVGIEYIYQHKMFRARKYNELIIKTMDRRERVREILQRFKTNEIVPDWQPLETYCSNCNRDRIKFGEYDINTKTIGYECKLCGHKDSLDLRESDRLKLPWRMDWAMRWAYEKVDFESAGNDHSSAGGSFDTGRVLVTEIYDGEPPVYAPYANIMPKGQTKKMSSSTGNGMSLNNVLKIYTPEMIRWIFASYKPNTSFNMAFDLDVLRTYEDFDMMERWVYGAEGDNEEKRAVWRRVYEVSQLDEMAPIPAVMPFQPAFRHLCNNLQMNEMNIAKTRKMYDGEIKNDIDEHRFIERAERAVFWLENYAPNDFTFSVNSAKIQLDMTEDEANFVKNLRATLLDEWDNFFDDTALQNRIGQLIEASGLDPKAAYRILYQLLISRDRGPKLAAFMRAVGKDRILALL